MIDLIKQQPSLLTKIDALIQGEWQGGLKLFSLETLTFSTLFVIRSSSGDSEERVLGSVEGDRHSLPVPLLPPFSADEVHGALPGGAHNCCRSHSFRSGPYLSFHVCVLHQLRNTDSRCARGSPQRSHQHAHHNLGRLESGLHLRPRRLPRLALLSTRQQESPREQVRTAH